MTDLVRDAKNGDVAAFEQLYSDHVGRVYALCLRMTADPARAEELSQDVFLRAWNKLATFRGDAAFSTWLHRLAVNVVLAERRSEGKRWARLVMTDDMAPFEGSGPAPAAGAGMDLEKAISLLPERARTVFVLYAIEGYRHDEIAEMTGTAVGTSKAQLHRGQEALAGGARTMSCETMESRLNDYVDEVLADEQRGELEEHLNACGSCREAIAALRTLGDEAAALPKNIMPTRDLWPEIVSRISSGKLVSVDFGAEESSAWSFAPFWQRYAALAAAALVLVVLSSGITAYLMRGNGGTGGGSTGGGSTSGGSTGVDTVTMAPVALTEFGPAESEYTDAIEGLQTILNQRRDSLDPETVTVIETSLRVIDRAIRRAKAALEDNPNNAELARMLSKNYRKKLKLLEKANRLIIG